MNNKDFLSNRVIAGDMNDIFERDMQWETLNNKTILITGAYGMLASYVTYFLIYINEIRKLNINIIMLVRSKEKAEERFGIYIKKDYLRIYTSDLSEPISLDEDIDYIIHAASLASPQYYKICPIDVLSPNVIGTYHLLNLAISKKIKGFLLFSTGSIYGKTVDCKMITETDYGIMDPLDIHSCYGESKRMAETMCKAWFVQRDVPVKVARIWHTYGPTMDIDNDPRVFASFVNDVISNRNIIMKSNGAAKRSFCYISDAVFGYFKILLEGVEGEAYNVCNTSEFISVRELGEILISLYPKKKLKVIMSEREKGDPYLENHSASYIVPSNDKLRSLGWECRYDCKIGFRRTIEAILHN